ncbi:MAG: tetratricopeptide repeat protein [Bacteroidia bacterium]
MKHISPSSVFPKGRNLVYTLIIFIISPLLWRGAGGEVSAQNKIDSLTNLLKTSIEDTNQARIHLNLSYAYSNSDYNKAIEEITKAYNLNKKLNNYRGLMTCANWFGILNAKKGNYKDALIYFNESIELSKKHFPKNNIGFILSNTGLVYRHLGNYTKAVEYFLNSIKYHSERNDVYGLSSVYNNLGNTYSDMHLNNEALKHHLLALKIEIKINDKRGIQSSYSNIGNVYADMEKPDSALYYYKKSLELINSQDKETLASLYDNLGYTYNTLAMYDSSLKYLGKSYLLFNELGDGPGMVNSTFSLARLYFSLNNFPQAEKYSLEGLAIATKTNQKSGERDAYKQLAKIYQAQKKYQKSIEYFVIYDSLDNHLAEVNSAQKIADLRTTFEIEKKQTEIEKLKQKETIQALAIENQQSRINRQRLGLILASLSGLLALGFVWLLFKSNKQRKKDNQLLKEQKEIITQKNKEVTDSINYARRIQQAVLTGEDVWNKISKENFILFKPKDIVSGDFYWAYISPNGRCIWAAADCTGHGVPGGFMSMLGNSFLNEIVIENHIYKADEILNRLREKVIRALEQKGGHEQKDGMDIALCVWNKVDNTLEFAGANNSACIVRNNELIELKPDKMPIGSYITGNKKFTSKSFKLQAMDVVYLSSDGFPDQFGGKNGKKFKYKQMEELLINHSEKPLTEQKEILETSFSTWKGSLEQVDDVMLIGVRI